MNKYVCKKCSGTGIHFDLNQQELWCNDCMDECEVVEYSYDEETDTGKYFNIKATTSRTSYCEVI